MTMMTTETTRKKQRAESGKLLLVLILGMGAASSGAFFSRRWADRWGEAYGGKFARAAARLVPSAEAEEVEAPLACDPLSVEEAHVPDAHAHVKKAAKETTPPIVVPLLAVERASRSKHLGGEDVPGQGVRVVGVSRFACGLADGDVIVAVGSLSKPSVASGTDYVLRALARGDRTISGKIERAGRTYDVLVPVPEKFFRDRSQNP